MIKSKYLTYRDLESAGVMLTLDDGEVVRVHLYRDSPFVEFRAGQDTIPYGTPGDAVTAIRRAATELANS